MQPVFNTQDLKSRHAPQESEFEAWVAASFLLGTEHTQQTIGTRWNQCDRRANPQEDKVHSSRIKECNTLEEYLLY